jgi:hypothetical protein
VWTTRLRRITQSWQELETLSVIAGLRECAICYVTPETLVDKTRYWNSEGLFGVPLQMLARKSGYSAVAHPPSSQDPIAFRVAVGRAHSVGAFAAAYDQDELKIGQLLGFPTCCVSFFGEVWTDRKLVDTTWPMAVNSIPAGEVKTEIAITPIRETNILWRWLGIRSVPHLPCSLHCEATAALGQAFIKLGRENGFSQEMDWLNEVLSWPIEWSCLHGIAEIRTPILKFVTNTDATPTKYVVKLLGSSFPTPTISGLRFPYQLPKKVLREDPFLQIDQVDKRERVSLNEFPDEAARNGFSSLAAMEAGHTPILSLLEEQFRDRDFNAGGYALDLGCGNGALLAKVHAIFPKLVPIGLEIDLDRVRSAQKKLRMLGGEAFAGNMFSSNDVWPSGRKYFLAIVCVTRFIETDSERTAELRRKILDASENILLYVYNDGLLRYQKNMNDFIADAGFALTGWKIKKHVAIFASERSKRSQKND